ncbi:3-hydroxyasparagine phosphotransferase [Streptomyces sp. enrichment culture]|uniref:3-hydroxyasparagine phosphotransferase n=1 Tax=Streptomyces sp. enrichment culture TaxID=1795815 RepID=UPI003F561CB6
MSTPLTQIETTFEPTVDELELVGLVHEVCPGLEPTAVVHRSRTSLVVAGVLGGTEVIAKVRTPDWRRQCLREIEAYDLFDRERPPVRVPRRLAADAGRAVLVTERLPGTVLAPERFPAPPLAERDLAGVLKAVRRLRPWRPEVPASWRVDYRPLVNGVLERRDLDERHEAALVRMLELAGEPREFGHGDLVLANVMRTGRKYTLIDWASAAVFLPCLDLAQLWLLLGDVPGARERIEAEVERLGDAREGLVPFLVNLTLLLYRERRAHTRFTDEVSVARAARLDAAWEAVRERVMRHAG